MVPKATKLRPAGKTERRCIMRQELGYYRNLTITALYRLDGVEASNVTVETFYPALKLCIATHPILSCTISEAASEAPVWTRPEIIDLRTNIKIIESPPSSGSPKDELKQLQEVLSQELDELYPFVPTILPWKIIILPVEKRPGEYYIILSISHAHADGQSGLAFHKTFLRGLKSTTTPDVNPLVTPPTTPLLPPLDATPMPISWSYLLGPLLGVYFPKFISKFLNIPTSVTPTTPDMWRGTPYTYDASDFHTGLELAIVSPSTLNAALAACRAHNTKLTGLLHQLIVRTLSACISDTPEHPAGSFVSQTPLNLRRIVPAISNDEMAVLTNAYYDIVPRIPASETDGELTEAIWTAAQKTTARLAEVANSLSDQPVGLLKYLAHFRMWMQNTIGKERDSSYEITNVMAFDPLEGEPDLGNVGPNTWTLGRTLMAQPANALGCPLSFNVASRKGGEMVIAITWQLGVLGLEGERKTVSEIGRRVCGDLDRLAAL